MRDTSRLKENLVDVLLDWLAAGLDPEKCVMFIQSHVPAHAELHLLLSMITPLGWLERVPTYKEQKENLKEKDLNTYGFLGYPVLQSADILIYKADVVPVGEDQVAHVELTREIARRFNGFYAYAHRWSRDESLNAGSKESSEFQRNENHAGYRLHFPTSRFPGTAGAVDAGSPLARHRRPQDVEVL